MIASLRKFVLLAHIDCAELLRLHVFREDNVVFSLAHRLISTAEFDAMQSAAAG